MNGGPERLTTRREPQATDTAADLAAAPAESVADLAADLATDTAAAPAESAADAAHSATGTVADVAHSATGTVADTADAAAPRGGGTEHSAASGREQVPGPSGAAHRDRSAPGGPGAHGHRPAPATGTQEQQRPGARPGAHRHRPALPPGADEPRPGSAAAARERVRRLLDGHAAAPLPPPVVDDILLVTSELVTNALRHGGGLAAFHAELDGGTVRIRVSDRSPTPPRSELRRRITAPGGFGWPLVQRLSRSVTVDVTPARDGKTVEAVLLVSAEGA
ncbi:ATP-binding protein [Streptomyces sp. PKU-MA01144]|uniref:ATP-binding protein n=1 Tax=Streptomyces sp. PKU-MA01144 TaxID=2729138 RepID=UPI00147B2E27|nr:ATP-binding protein [Streptomyces sp. PKU-MA01144]NNJ07007.1 ATP-binding protein [Streptomyces sp. PKU-MA01144]